MINANEFVIYSGFTYAPLGCGVDGTFEVVSEEIITTSKGSGRATNREYGSYDWSFTGSAVLDRNFESGVSESFTPMLALKNGLKVVVMGHILNSVGQQADRVGGIGIVTSYQITGSAGEFLSFNFTIKGDGPLFVSDGLVDVGGAESAFAIYDVTTSGTSYTNSLLEDRNIAFVAIGDIPVPPSQYSFDKPTGVITIATEVGERITIFVKG